MHIYLKSKDEKIQQMIVKGYTAPTVITTDGTTGPKPEDTQDDYDFNKSKWNNEGLNAIQCNMTEEEFRKIYNCTNLKQACDILRVVYEGTNIVKNSKIQRLTTDIENIKMGDSESFSNSQN